MQRSISKEKINADLDDLQAETTKNDNSNAKKRSASKRQIFNLNAKRSEVKTLQSPKSMKRSQSNAQTQKLDDGAELGESIIEEHIKSTSQMQHVDSTANMSTTTVQSKTQWYLKPPKNRQNTFIDDSYKVVPSLNHNQRVLKLNQITKDNLKLYARIQGIKSDYNVAKMRDQSNRQEMHRRRLNKFDLTG